MIPTSYKPREGQLLLTPTLREYFLKFFKGIKPKPLRMSGDLYKATMIDFIGGMQEGQSINETEHKNLMLNIVSTFRRTIAEKEKSIKKRSYITGYSTKGFQLMLTQSTYPVPHLPWAGISLITLDVGEPGTNKQLIKYVSWEVTYAPTVDDNLISYYNSIIKRVVDVDAPLVEGLEDMIFEMVAPPELIPPKELCKSTSIEFNKAKQDSLIATITEAILQTTEPMKHRPESLPIRLAIDPVPMSLHL